MRELQLDRFEPFPDARLTGVDLLPSADETDHDSPRVVPVEIRDEELRFRPS